MDLRGLGSLLETMQSTSGTAAAKAATAVKPAGGASFTNALADALRGVSTAQNEAGALQRRYAAGDPEVGLEQTMLAMQKSQVAFQAAVTVRNRLVSSYTDIMNMSV